VEPNCIQVRTNIVSLIHVQIFEHFRKEKISSVLYMLSMCETSSELFKHYKAILLTGDLQPYVLNARVHTFAC